MRKKREERLNIWTKFVMHWQQAFALVQADLCKLRHDPIELLTRMIQPIIWLLIFGQAMAKAKVIAVNASSYLDFIVPGVLAQSYLFVGVFFGIALIWERDMGILQKILVSPAPRSILIFGRAMCGAIRSLSQIFVVYFLAYLLGVNLQFSIGHLLGMCGIVMIGGATFTALSLSAAAIVKKRERFLGIGQALTMPLFFASNALYPIDMMPAWLKTLSLLNPLTYQVDALRHFMIIGEVSRFGLGIDFGVSLLTLALIIAVATPLFPRILY